MWSESKNLESKRVEVINGKHITVVLPAYNAEKTLRRTVSELDTSIIDEILLVDDASSDKTFELAQELGIRAIKHEKNLGYGGNQKTCYRTALNNGADIVVMIHPDYQYSPKLTIPLASMIAYGEYDVVLGSRILAQNAMKNGMPVYKYVANRILTLIENLMVGAKLSEYHTGLRAFSKEVIQAIPTKLNSDDFVFDNQMIAQVLTAGARIGEVSCPTRYESESSSINFRRSVKYGFGVLRTAWQFRLNKQGLKSYPYLKVNKLHTK